MEQEKSKVGFGSAAADLVKNRDKIAKLAQSNDAKQLMNMLQQQNGGIKQAAQAAATGDPSQLMAMMNRLMSSKEGANLVERIGNEAKKAGLD